VSHLLILLLLLCLLPRLLHLPFQRCKMVGLPCSQPLHGSCVGLPLCLLLHLASLGMLSRVLQRCSGGCAI